MAAVDWFGAAESAPAPQRVAAAPRRRAKPVAHGRRLTGWIVWISLFAAILAGVVALNVAVLRANVAVNRLDRKEAQLQEQNAALASQVSAASASLRIEAAARRLGLVPAPAADTAYLDLGRP
ncbi:MAG TPA: hypothetical protein VMB53_00955 [Gaiellaceae bacterium]|nr:hypothetical protein [Gaiellaceae bacterium]